MLSHDSIQEYRKNSVEFVANWFTKEANMDTYSNYIKVIKGEEFWEDILGEWGHNATTTYCEENGRRA